MNSNNLNSYLILDSLSDGSKYGLEIIEHISQKTGGQIIMKKPSLYSSLTRMEKKGLISSSYWGDSEIGGKRHYYTITNSGKVELSALVDEYQNQDLTTTSLNSEPVKDDGVFLDSNKRIDTIGSSSNSIEDNTNNSSQTQPQNSNDMTYSKSEIEAYENTTHTVENKDKSEEAPKDIDEDESTSEKPMFLQQNNMFDTQKVEQTSDDDDDESDVLENQMDIFSLPPQNQSSQEARTQNNENYLTNNVSDNVSTSSNNTSDNISSTVSNNNQQTQTNLFESNFVAQNSQTSAENNDTNVATSSDQEKMDYYQNKLTSNETSRPQESEQDPKDDAVMLDDNDRIASMQEQNRRIYDTSLELKKYRKRKSFSENQIEMAVIYEKDEDRRIQKDRIEQLKKSMLNARQNGYNSDEIYNNYIKNENSHTSDINSDINYSNNTEQGKKYVDLSTPNASNFSTQTTSNYATQSASNYQTQAVSNYQTQPASNNSSSANKTEEVEEIKDDAIFITEPVIDRQQIPIQKKITPPNIDINIYDNNLPAPKRDTNLEPTYKDMMAKLFENKKEKVKQPENVVIEQEQKVENFADYDNLKKYYSSHNISFKEYNKTSIKRVHNTNLLNFVLSTILLALSGIGSAIFYAIIKHTNNLHASTNFMFYTLPIIFLVYTIYTLIRYKVSISRKPALIYNSVINWAVFIFATVIVFIINICCGMQFETMAQYMTSLLLPIYGLLLILPVNYYFKWFTYRKFGK